MGMKDFISMVLGKKNGRSSGLKSGINPAEFLGGEYPRPPVKYEWNVTQTGKEPVALLGFDEAKAGDKIGITLKCGDPTCGQTHTFQGTIKHRWDYEVTVGDLSTWGDDEWGTPNWGAQFHEYEVYIISCEGKIESALEVGGKLVRMQN